MINLIHGNCMDYMKTLEDNTFDLCVTSPPYNMNLRVNSKGNGYCSRQIVKELSTKYKSFDDNLPMEYYSSFLFNFIDLAVKKCGTLFLNIQMVTGNKPAIFEAVGAHSKLLKEVVVWDKMNAQPSIAEDTFNSQFEFIFVFGGNPITRQFKHPAGFDRGSISNVWKIKKERSADKNHKASYPIALTDKILSLYKGKNIKVLDPFLGTGTTAISAHKLNFDFVGVELDEGYYKAAKERVSSATAQIDMFGGAA